MVEERVKRVVAKITSSRALLDGTFVSEDNFSNYILFHGEKLHKVNIIGIVVDKNKGNNFVSFVLDDGFGTIEARIFGNVAFFSNITIGSCVICVGRPRSWQDHLYLGGDFIKIIDPLWLKHRRLLIEKTKQLSSYVHKKNTDKKEIKKEILKEKLPIINFVDIVLDAVKKLDSGDGADIEAVISLVNSDRAEDLIQNLINEGELFEFKPGRIKHL